MRRLLVINQYFYPDIASTGRYATDICSGLTRFGYDVYAGVWGWSPHLTLN